MKMKHFFTAASLFLAIGALLIASPAAAAQPIVLGCPLSTAFLYGWGAERRIHPRGRADQRRGRGAGRRRKTAVQNGGHRHPRPGARACR
ncbi:MAG: hypothetical protein MZU95_00255 [Desulfomicrobium escambiense]|nr:hypothetical protein [Desulfomicrobium escambiense]